MNSGGSRKHDPRRSPSGAPGKATGGRAPQGANGARTPQNGVAKRPLDKPPQRSERLGAPRTPPVGETPVHSADEASQMGPEQTRVYRWAPRCRVCGYPMRGTVEVTAPAEGPDRHSFDMDVAAVLCPRCRNSNFLGAFTSWLVVSGPLPVEQPQS